MVTVVVSAVVCVVVVSAFVVDAAVVAATVVGTPRLQSVLPTLCTQSAHTLFFELYRHHDECDEQPRQSP